MLPGRALDEAYLLRCRPCNEPDDFPSAKFPDQNDKQEQALQLSS